MSELILDDAVAAALSSIRGEVVLRDRSGKEIGKFRRTMSPEEMAERNPFTLEDLEAAQRDPASRRAGMPLSEFWKRLREEEPK
jgi:hypothetical protein